MSSLYCRLLHVYTHSEFCNKFKCTRFTFNSVSQALRYTLSHLLPIFFLHTVHTFSSVIMHFTCWCKILSSWTYRKINNKLKEIPQKTMPHHSSLLVWLNWKLSYGLNVSGYVYINKLYSTKAAGLQSRTGGINQHSSYMNCRILLSTSLVHRPRRSNH